MEPAKMLNRIFPTRILRLGADYIPLEPESLQFSRTRDPSQSALPMHRTRSCPEASVARMLPAFMVHLEEEHSPRGRAHMRFTCSGRSSPEMVGAASHEELALFDLVSFYYQIVQIRMYLKCRHRDLQSRVFCPTTNEKIRPTAYAFGMIDRWAMFRSIAPNL